MSFEVEAHDHRDIKAPDGSDMNLSVDCAFVLRSFHKKLSLTDAVHWWVAYPLLDFKLDARLR